MWAVPSGNFIPLPSGNYFVDPFGNFAAVPVGNLNPVAPGNFIAVPPANSFPVPFGNFFPMPSGNPYAMAPGNFTSVSHQNLILNAVPPVNYNSRPSRNCNVGSTKLPQRRPSTTLEFCSTTKRVNASPPRNVNAESQKSSCPSVKEFSKNPQQYPGFVLVMLLSTGKIAVMSRGEAQRNARRVKVVSSPGESRSGNSSFFRR